MPNDKKNALRYLLLRFLWTYREVVDENLYQEIAKTLTVGETDESFEVKWIRDGYVFEKNYGKDEFEFYIHRDKAKQGAVHDANHQHITRLGREFARRALGVDKLKEEITVEPFFPGMLSHFIVYSACTIFLLLVGGKGFFVATTLLLILLTVEFWFPSGKMLVPPLIAILVPNGFPFTAIVTAAFYFLFQSLDPDKKWRGIRLLASLAVFSYGLFEVTWNGIVPFCNTWVVLLSVIVLVTFLIRWTAGSHFRLMPLVFPFVSIGVYLDGFVQPVMILVVFGIFSALLAHKGYRFFPVQKER